MFYFLIAIIVLCLVILIQRDRREQDKYLVLMLLAFVIDIFALILYVSRDVYYYSVLDEYFSFPDVFWNMAMYSEVSRFALNRVINISSIAFVILSLLFSLQFMQEGQPISRRVMRICVIAGCVVYVLFDPGVYRMSYMRVCGTVLSPGTIQSIRMVISVIARVINLSLLIYADISVIRSVMRGNRVALFRVYSILECVAFVSVQISYLFVFWFAPAVLIEVSALADYVVYRQIPLTEGSLIIYRIYPYVLFVSIVVIAGTMLAYLHLQNRLRENNFAISSKIDASETTSKAFCHYMKNEILAIQAEIEMLEVQEESREDQRRALQECDYLYARLDEIHKSTKMTELQLRRNHPDTLMDQILEHMQSQLQNCTVTTDYAADMPEAMLDAVYYEQAIHNILCNAAEAMRGTTPAENRITISMHPVDHNLQIEIADNGAGISPHIIDQIFTPFVSSQPITKHWGIGLALTYKIIKAHGGTITVSSQVGQGTVFTILLPTLLVFGYGEGTVKVRGRLV